MKKIARILIAAFAAVCLVAPAPTWAGMSGDWLEGANGYARGTDQAQANRKPMAVYFYTDWCPYCRKLEKSTLSDSEVKKALSDFVLVRINPEKGSREYSLADQYRISGYPAVFFISPATGKRTREITRVARTPDDFVRAVQQFVELTRANASAAAPIPEVSKPVPANAVVPAEVKPEQRLFLNNGRSLDGKVTTENSEGVTFATTDLGEVYFSRSEVKKIESLNT